MSTPVGTPRPGLTPRPQPLTRGPETSLTKMLIEAAHSFTELAKRAENAAKGTLEKQLIPFINSLKEARHHLVGVCRTKDLLKDNSVPKKIISTAEQIEKSIKTSGLEELGVILSALKTITTLVLREAEKEQNCKQI